MTATTIDEFDPRDLARTALAADGIHTPENETYLARQLADIRAVGNAIHAARTVPRPALSPDEELAKPLAITRGARLLQAHSDGEIRDILAAARAYETSAR